MRTAIVAAWVALAGCGAAAGHTRPPAAVPREDAFAREIRFALASCDIAALEKLFDVDALAARVAAVHPETLERDSVRGAIGARGTLAGVLCEDEEDHPSYTFLRDDTRNGRREILFRVVLASGNFNYLAFAVRESAWTVRIVEATYYYSGETLSGLLAAWLDARIHVDDGFWRDLDAAEERHDLDRARTVIQQLPVAQRSWRKVIRREIRLARDASAVRDLEEATARYAATFETRVPLEIMGLDIAWARKAYRDVLKLVDELDGRVGGDPYLDSIRADAYRHLGDHAKAVERARHATDGDPSVESAWWMLATAQTAAHDFRGAIKTLDLLRERFGADVSNATLRTDDRFADLVLSWEYRRSSLRGIESDDDDADP